MSRSYAVLARRRIGDLCLGTPFVLLLLAQQAMLFFLQRSAFASLEANGLMVALHPAEYGLLAAVVLLALWVVAYAAPGPARERESGALETLFYGPVTAADYVLAELTAVGAAVSLSLALLAGALVIGRAAVAYDVPLSLLSLAPLCLLFLLAAAAAAICGALVFRQERTATALAVLLLLLSLASFAGDLFLAQYESGASLFVVFLRSLLSRFSLAFRWVFPLGLFLEDLVRYEGTGAFPPAHVAWYAAYACLFTLAAVRVLRLRGVAAR
jgi:ABC-type multidrug transport system permease subunit